RRSGKAGRRRIRCRGFPTWSRRTVPFEELRWSSDNMATPSRPIPLTLLPGRLFAWNMPYHAEHHAYPAVPFHALPQLHARIRGKIDNLELGYVTASAKVVRYLFSGQAPSVLRRG